MAGQHALVYMCVSASAGLGVEAHVSQVWYAVLSGPLPCTAGTFPAEPSSFLPLFYLVSLLSWGRRLFTVYRKPGTTIGQDFRLIRVSGNTSDTFIVLKGE